MKKPAMYGKVRPHYQERRQHERFNGFRSDRNLDYILALLDHRQHRPENRFGNRGVHDDLCRKVMADGEKGKTEMKQGRLTVKNPNGKTYRIPASSAGSVRMACQQDQTVLYGNIADRLGAYEDLGLPEEFAELLKLYRK